MSVSAWTAVVEQGMATLAGLHDVGQCASSFLSSLLPPCLRLPSLHMISWIAEDALIAFLIMVLVATLICGWALKKNYYRAALKVNAVRKLREGKPMTDSDKKFKTALQAETVVENLLKKEGWKYVFPNRRVAVSRLGHNREIDIIAIGPQILVIEVKHWRGFVWSSGNAWYQCPYRKAQALMFENVYSDNVEKAAALRRFIENQRRIPLPDAKEIFGGWASPPGGVVEHADDEDEGQEKRKNKNGKGEEEDLRHEEVSQQQVCPNTILPSSSTTTGTWYSDRALHTMCGTVVVPVVIFTNPDVRLDTHTILREYENVFTLETFREYLKELSRQQQSRAWQWCWHGFPSFWNPFFKPKQDARRGAGSTRLKGEEESPHSFLFLEKKKERKKSKNKKDTSFLSSTATEEEEKKKNVGEHNRSAKKGVVALLSGETQRKVAEAVDMLRTWDVLQLHNGQIVTGDVQAVIAPTAFCSYERKHLLQIHLHWNSGFLGLLKTFLMNKSGFIEIVLTSEKRLAIKKKENKPRNAEGNIVFPFRPRHKKIGGSDRFLVRSPGNPRIVPILIADVKNISLSKHLYLTENIIKE